MKWNVSTLQKKMRPGVAGIGLVCLALSACSLRERDVKYGVSFKMPSSMQNRIVGRSASSTALTEPTSLNEVQCFALNISGPGISPDPRFECGPDSSMGIMAGMVPVSGGRVDAMVPAGASRKIQLVGVNTASGICPSFEEYFAMKAAGGGDGTLGEPYLLGEATVDVFGDVTVNISPSFDSSRRAFQECGGGGSNNEQPTLTFQRFNESSALAINQCNRIAIEARNTSSAAGVTVWPSVESITPSAGSATLHLTSNCSDTYNPSSSSPLVFQSGSSSNQIELYMKSSVLNAAVELKVNTTATGWNQPLVAFNFVNERLKVNGSYPTPTPAETAPSSCQSFALHLSDSVPTMREIPVSTVLKFHVYRNATTSGSPATQFFLNAGDCVAGSNALVPVNAPEWRRSEYTITATGSPLMVFMRSSVAENIHMSISDTANLFQPIGVQHSWLPFKTSGGGPTQRFALNPSGALLSLPFISGANSISQVRVGGIDCPIDTASRTDTLIKCLAPNSSLGFKNVELHVVQDGQTMVHASNFGAQYINFTAGQGTAASPFQITLPQQLDVINSGFAGEHYRIQNSIDVSTLGVNSVPIINSLTAGTSLTSETSAVITGLQRPLIGQCFGLIQDLTIMNAAVSMPTAPSAGVVCNSLEAGASALNIIVAGSSSISCGGIACSVGLFAGSSNSSGVNVSNIKVAGNVSATNGSNTNSVGGVIGRINDGIFDRLSSEAAVSGISLDHVGGVVGVLQMGAVKRAIKKLGVTSGGSGTTSSLGGVVGLMAGGTLEESANEAQVNGFNGSVGGVVGLHAGGAIRRVMMNGPISGGASYAGGLIGHFSSPTASVQDAFVGWGTTINSSVAAGGVLGKISANGTIDRVYTMAQNISGSAQLGKLSGTSTINATGVSSFVSPTSMGGVTVASTGTTITQVSWIALDGSPTGYYDDISKYGVISSAFDGSTGLTYWRSRSTVPNGTQLNSPTLRWACEPVINWGLGHTCY